ncbi:serine--tRNA ligase [candidate division WWE3 bacterium CG_4_10_14_0_2_um_filter_42_7]|uniref:Serine--tRNA ligase n=2 Tax=Katanobacteria TaxID=422282 RepID=A0A2H0X914_UNCKA|nr:MAG: serine--tRNA ligase [candidate division WWE3 bacterium CG08_land_8_20_14_0_20_41_15]PIZ43704.1 MAG: serine--tRNA ligase [candidate division WWE3 bacterium CG_4_10_14_0_2_um_filter_42_7]
MLDIKYILENKESVKEAVKNRGKDASIVDKTITLDAERKTLIQKAEELRAKRNKLGKDDREEGAKIKEELKEIEPKLKEAEESFLSALKLIPNIPAPDVPIGKDDTENLVVRTEGTVPTFDFKIKDHLDLGVALDVIDVERAAKVSGARFGYFKNDAVLLEFALIDFVMKKLIRKGFSPVVPPVIIKKEMEEKMGYSEHGGFDNMYVFDKDDMVFVASSEHSVIPMHADEVFEEKDLPRRYVNFSTCFRRESGAYGKDTRGILRVHQFDKLEMNVYTTPEKSDAECEFLLSCQEEIVKELGLSYRVVKSCTGDLPNPNRRMYDIEAWFPGQNTYREITSCSNCTDYQTRRLNIKLKRDGKTEFVHALNATATAIGRVIAAILENYQQEDGTVKIPTVLKEYVGKDFIGIN